ncbi:MAG TPA: ferredoxin family protein [Blastocatellia bacterium]|nr:ferredoxin family protein [Blastocatellia bacterium]
MAFVICEPCIGAKELACVDVCPVDCIQGGPAESQTYIDPKTCIDCAACEPACPVSAIFAEADVPAKWENYIAKNADFFRLRN